MALKNDILNLLCTHSDTSFSLMNIIKSLQLDSDKYKPIVFYHLKQFVKYGKVIKNEDKSYSFIDTKGAETINIPYIGDARAGDDVSFIDENGITSIPVKTSLIHHNPKELILVSVRGDSMAPTLQDKALVMFKKVGNTDYIPDNEIVFCRYDNGFKIKRFKRLNENYCALISDNEEFSPIIINENNDFEIKGKFVSVIN